jgi:hypothetical protein
MHVAAEVSQIGHNLPFGEREYVPLERPQDSGTFRRSYAYNSAFVDVQADCIQRQQPSGIADVVGVAR